MSEAYLHLADVASLAEIPTDGTLSRTLHNDAHQKVVLFSFSAGQELSEHTASMPAVMHFLKGESDVTLGDDAISGPYSERRFAGRFLGHGTPFQDREGRWWCTAFYNANIPPESRDGIESRDLGDTARTINARGTTIVPLDVRLLPDGALFIRAKDPAYATPGPDELQSFEPSLPK